MSNVEAFSYAALVTPAVFGSMFGTIENELPDSAFSYSSPLAPIKNDGHPFLRGWPSQVARLRNASPGHRDSVRRSISGVGVSLVRCAVSKVLQR